MPPRALTEHVSDVDTFGMDASRVRRAGADCAVLEPRCTGRSLVEVLIKYAVMNVRPWGSAEKRANPTAVHRFAVPDAACRA